MEERYRLYFERQYDGLSFGRLPYPLGPVSMLSLLDEIPQNRWRPDARYFLATNVLEMVIAPIELAGPPRMERRQFLEYMQEDVRRLALESETVARERGRDYVSGTSVAIALGRLAEDLLTTSLNVWGPEERGEARS